MAKEHKAPQAVIDQAEKVGMNTVRYVGSYKGSDVWSAVDVDENGSVVPTGLPVLISHKDGYTEAVYGEKAFQLFDSLEP